LAKENEQLRTREKHMKRQQERMARSSNGYSGSDWKNSIKLIASEADLVPEKIAHIGVLPLADVGTRSLLFAGGYVLCTGVDFVQQGLCLMNQLLRLVLTNRLAVEGSTFQQRRHFAQQWHPDAGAARRSGFPSLCMPGR